MTARPVTTTDLWKLVGLVLVLIDHWGLLFADDPSWRVVGRAAAPIFFFFIGLARTRRVPWSWVVLGLVLTAAESWTSGTGLGKINLNILINFAFVRLLLPEVERRVMPHPWVAALLAMAIVLLIRPFQQILEYGAEGWLWALFGLSHRLALEAQHPIRDGHVTGPRQPRRSSTQPRRSSTTASTAPKAQCWPASSPRSPWR